MNGRGQIVILNGAPRAGKSSIAAVVQWQEGVHDPGVYDVEGEPGTAATRLPAS